MCVKFSLVSYVCKEFSLYSFSRGLQSLIGNVVFVSVLLCLCVCVRACLPVHVCDRLSYCCLSMLCVYLRVCPSIPVYGPLNLLYNPQIVFSLICPSALIIISYAFYPCIVKPQPLESRKKLICVTVERYPFFSPLPHPPHPH